eukprot:COSAG02_NODE_952_length_15692_cov_7.587764_5_plen_321_part_00
MVGHSWPCGVLAVRRVLFYVQGPQWIYFRLPKHTIFRSNLQENAATRDGQRGSLYLSARFPYSKRFRGAATERLAAMAQTPASTRWRLSGQLPDGHASLAEPEDSATIREAQRAAATAARDIRRTAAQHEDVTARLRALRSSSAQTPTLQTASSAGAVASRATSPVPRRGFHTPFRPSALGTPRSHGAATRAAERQRTPQPAASSAAEAADRHLRTLFEPPPAGTLATTSAAVPAPAAPPMTISSPYYVRSSTGETQPSAAKANGSPQGAPRASRGMPRGQAAEASLRDLFVEIQSGATHIDRVLMLQKHADRIVSLLES